MEIYKIVFSLVLPGLVFSKNCGYLQTLEPYGLDVERSSSKGANVDIIAEIKSNSLAHCFEACCNATEIGNYKWSRYPHTG